MNNNSEDLTASDSKINTLYWEFRRLNSKFLTGVQRDRKSEFAFSLIYLENILWNFNKRNYFLSKFDSTVGASRNSTPHMPAWNYW